MNLPRALCTTLALLIAGSANAETVYRRVDADGRVTYSSTPPANGEKAEAVEVDPNRNVVAPETSPEIERLESEERQRYYQQKQVETLREDDREAAIAAAEAQLQQALDAQEAGQALQPGDLIGKQSGGTRPSLQRTERLQYLEDDVNAARENLERVRSGR